MPNFSKRSFLFAGGVFSVLLLVIFQTSWVNYLGFFAEFPNLLLALILAVSVSLGQKTAAYIAFFGGIFYDVISLGTVGFTPFLILISLVFLSVLRRVLPYSTVSYFPVFYLIALIYRLIVSGLPFRPAFLLGSLLDVFSILALLLFLRSASAVFNPPSSIQLKFKELR